MLHLNVGKNKTPKVECGRSLRSRPRCALIQARPNEAGFSLALRTRPPHSPSALALRTRPPHSPLINDYLVRFFFVGGGGAPARSPALSFCNRRYSWLGHRVPVSFFLVRCARAPPLRHTNARGCISVSPPRSPSALAPRRRTPPSPSALALISYRFSAGYRTPRPNITAAR